MLEMNVVQFIFSSGINERAEAKQQKRQRTSGAKLRGKMMVRLTVLMIVIKYSRLTRGGKKSPLSSRCWHASTSAAVHAGKEKKKWKHFPAIS